MNYILISFEDPERDRMLGIYPHYEEANFIRSKVLVPNQCIISETDKPITTEKVGDFLRRSRQWWKYKKGN